MAKDRVDDLMKEFMRPTVFTGVEPLFIIAEELETQEHTGGVIDAVWVHWDDENKTEFSYITKFAVRGKILDGQYYTPEELSPFKGRLALPERANFEKLVQYKAIQEEINALKAKRHALSDHVQKDFEALGDIIEAGKEVFCFKRADGDWSDPFFNIDIYTPYEIVQKERCDSQRGVYRLKHPNGGVKEYTLKNVFYAFIVGSKADISGLQLKDESYKKKIAGLKEDAREALASIDWLPLSDKRLKAVMQQLPKHPFEEYFKYVKKGEERKIHPPQHLVQALEQMIAKHMPKLNTPLGINYVPIDNLLYLLHEIIPRPEALQALKACDVIYEPSAIILGFEGKREGPPKFLVPVSHAVEAYRQFPLFIEACERYLNEKH